VPEKISDNNLITYWEWLLNRSRDLLIRSERVCFRQWMIEWNIDRVIKKRTEQVIDIESVTGGRWVTDRKGFWVTEIEIQSIRYILHAKYLLAWGASRWKGKWRSEGQGVSKVPYAPSLAANICICKGQQSSEILCGEHRELFSVRVNKREF
jgi:hypothetical protein